MGNYSSCFCIHPQTAKIIDSTGNFRRLVKPPVKAIELMLEEPGYVVSAVHEVFRTGRMVALRAEDELLAGKVYCFVPVSRVNRKISESEMGIIESAIAAKKICRKKKRSARVLPADVKEHKETVAEGEVLEEEDSGFAECRLGNYRQWTPALETITEE